MSERKPDVTAFRCPECGAEVLNDTMGGLVTMSPPTCGWTHTPREMEQVYLGSDAYRKDSA